MESKSIKSSVHVCRLNITESIKKERRQRKGERARNKEMNEIKLAEPFFNMELKSQVTFR